MFMMHPKSSDRKRPRSESDTEASGNVAKKTFTPRYDSMVLVQHVSKLIC